MLFLYILLGCAHVVLIGYWIWTIAIGQPIPLALMWIAINGIFAARAYGIVSTRMP